MNRRSILKALAAAAGMSAADPEELLWKPGKLVSIPSVVTPKVMVETDHRITYDFLMNNADRLRSEVEFAKRFMIPGYRQIMETARARGLAGAKIVPPPRAKGLLYQQGAEVDGRPVRIVAGIDPVAGDYGRVEMVFRTTDLVDRATAAKTVHPEKTLRQSFLGNFR